VSSSYGRRRAGRVRKWVDAVECAVAIQNGVAEREAAEVDGRRIQFRIGINLVTSSSRTATSWASA
jgi:class 3 adenylate cyclase